MSMFSDSLRAFLKPVMPFLDDPEVSEVLINGPREIWVEKRGKLHATDATFTEDGLLAAARNMAQYVGRPLSDERPRLDARLPDGSRIHVVLPPVARRGTTISIRKFMGERLTPHKLLELGSVTPLMARFLQAAVGLELNIVIAGGTGSGKTSLLNVLSSFIGPEERILTIEDSAELQLQQKHLVTFESRPPDKFGKGAVDIGDLLHSALRLRPDRIVVGEVRGGEAFYLLQAMNTGHGGSLTSAHANSPVDTLRRLESLCLLSGVELPLRAVRSQVASAVHLVVCCARIADGTRKVTYIAEVLPLDANGEYRVQDLFVWVQTARLADGTIEGHHAPTGLLPSFFGRLAASGYADLIAELFHPAAHALPAPVGFSQGLGDSAVRAPPPKPGELPQVYFPGPAGLHDGDVSGAFALAGSSGEHPPLESTDPSARSVAEKAPAPAPSAAPVPTPTATAKAAQAKTAAAPRARATVRKPENTDPDLVAKPAQPVVQKAPAEPEASIELHPELAAELERAMPTESTLITRNPLLDRPARAAPLDEDTHPGRRAPTKR